MIIQCTRKLLDQLKVKPVEGVEEEPLYSWYANLITINRRKVVVLVNDKNRYSIVLYGLKAKEFKYFDKHIIQAIRQTLQQECIKKEVIDEFLSSSGQVTYTKTKNRSMVAKMSDSCNIVYYYPELLDGRTIYQPELSRKVNRYIVKDRQGDYIYPNKEVYKELKTLTGKSIFRCKAVVMKITLELEDYNIWRKIIVPVSISFINLHQIIQTSFGWKDYHLHEFYIYDYDVKKELFLDCSPHYDLRSLWKYVSR